MWVAISQRNDANKNGDLTDNLESNYVGYFEKFGVKLIVIPNSIKHIDNYLQDMPIEAVILSGGNSVSPNLYGGKTDKETNYSWLRDQTEKKLLEMAIEKKLPVLGICRGMQFINVFFKGKLVDIKGEVKNHVEHVRNDHEIEITDKEAIKILGTKSKVNSYHNNAVIDKLLGNNLKSFAQTSDGIIEGIYHTSLPIAGIQWHPERKSPDEKVNEKIIKAFLKRELFWKK